MAKQHIIVAVVMFILFGASAVTTRRAYRNKD